MERLERSEHHFSDCSENEVSQPQREYRLPSEARIHSSSAASILRAREDDGPEREDDGRRGMTEPSSALQDDRSLLRVKRQSSNARGIFRVASLSLEQREGHATSLFETIVGRHHARDQCESLRDTNNVPLQRTRP